MGEKNQNNFEEMKNPSKIPQERQTRIINKTTDGKMSRLENWNGENGFNKIRESMFHNLKNNIPIKVQEAYGTTNKLKQKP